MTYEEFEKLAIEMASEKYGKPIKLDESLRFAISCWYNDNENIDYVVEAILNNAYYWDM